MKRSTASKSTPVALSLLLALSLAQACDGPEEGRPQAAIKDAGPTPAQDAGVGLDATPDGAHIVDGAPDAASPADAGPPDAGRCERVRVPMWPGFEPGVATLAAHVSLEQLCTVAYCPPTLADLTVGLQCGPWVEPEPDGGCYPDGWARREGCGKVQFDTYICSWPRSLTFDAASGALIGAAQLDDIGSPLTGTACNDAAYVGGTLLEGCANEVRSWCQRKR